VTPPKSEFKFKTGWWWNRGSESKQEKESPIKQKGGFWGIAKGAA